MTAIEQIFYHPCCFHTLEDDYLCVSSSLAILSCKCLSYYVSCFAVSTCSSSKGTDIYGTLPGYGVLGEHLPNWSYCFPALHPWSKWGGTQEAELREVPSKQGQNSWQLVSCAAKQKWSSWQLEDGVGVERSAVISTGLSYILESWTTHVTLHTCATQLLKSWMINPNLKLMCNMFRLIMT